MYYLLKCRKCGARMFVELENNPGKTASRKCECGEVAVIKSVQEDGRYKAGIVSGDMEPA